MFKKTQKMILRFVGYFENVAIYELDLWKNNSRAVALPGFGIILGKGQFKTAKSTLRHEYGHILQAKKWGKLFFYFFVATISVRSAISKKYYHQDTWTEWTANILSYEYLNKPKDWNFIFFPLKFKNYSPWNLPKIRLIKEKLDSLK